MDTKVLSQIQNDPAVKALEDKISSTDSTVDFGTLLQTESGAALDKAGVNAPTQAVITLVVKALIKKLDELEQAKGHKTKAGKLLASFVHLFASHEPAEKV